MSLLTAMRAIQEVEAAIELSAAVKSSLKLQSGRVKRAYVVAPASNRTLTDLPCFINWPDAMPEHLRMGNFVERAFSVQVDFYAEADDSGGEVALAFFDATLAAFEAQQPANRRFGGTVSYVGLRAERPLIETLEWAGSGYPGFHLFLDIVLLETVVPV